MRTVEQRFLDLCIPEPNSGCWLWLGCAYARSANSYEYGRFRHGKEQLAHRVSHVLWNGPIPEGQIVRHKCDNSYCVNPEHLETGTLKDNVHDCLSRGRHVAPKGESHGRSKRTLEQVIEARRALKAGERPTRVARRLGIPIGSLHRVWSCWPDADKFEPRRKDDPT